MKTKKNLIVIPARYASTRLPGKPLVIIKGQSMLERVVRLSREAASQCEDTSVIVATDDERIMQHCDALQVEAVMTSRTCRTGTDRIAETISQLDYQPDFVVNMQGDAPLTPPHFLRKMILSYRQIPCDCITPVTQLSWDALEALRHHKKTTPFSGTTAIFNHKTGEARWFSKSIIPAIRNEASMRQQSQKSPVFRHIGLYGYRVEVLQQYLQLPESDYEQLEGLEQLRLLENGLKIRCVEVDYRGFPNMSGVDSPEDIVRAEALLAEFGEIV